MPHARQAIREAVATAVTGLATTGSRVFQSRMRAQDALPCLLVTTDGESITEEISGVQQRELEIRITGVAKAAANVDDTLDTIASEVETAVQAAGTLGALVSIPPTLTAISTDFDDSLEQPVGEIALTFRSTYFTNAGAPGTTL